MTAEVMGSNPVKSPEFFRFMRQLLKLSSKCEVMGSNPVESHEFFRFMRQLLKLFSISSFDFKHRTSYIHFFHLFCLFVFVLFFLF